MAELIKLDKFVDSRGWSVNDVYLEVRKRIRKHNTPYHDEVISPLSYQINYSHINPGIIKAWHRHKNQDDYFFVVHGMAQVGVCGPNGKNPEKFFIGEHNPALVHIRAGEWHGLTPLGTEPCGLLYYVTNEYDSRRPDEERAPWNDFVGSGWWNPEFK